MENKAASALTAEALVNKLAGNELFMRILDDQVRATGTIDIESAFATERQIIARFAERAGVETICDPDSGRVVYVGRMENPTQGQREFMSSLSGQIYNSLRKVAKGDLACVGLRRPKGPRVFH